MFYVIEISLYTKTTFDECFVIYQESSNDTGYAFTKCVYNFYEEFPSDRIMMYPNGTYVIYKDLTRRLYNLLDLT